MYIDIKVSSIASCQKATPKPCGSLGLFPALLCCTWLPLMTQPLHASPSFFFKTTHSSSHRRDSYCQDTTILPLHRTMRAAPIPTRSRSSTTTGVPSRSANAPTHIALPAAPSSSSWTNNAFAAFGTGRQNGSGGGGGSASGSARGSPGGGTPGSLPGTPATEFPGVQATASREQHQQRPITSPSSPRSSFLPNFIQRTRARSSTLSGRRNQGSSGQPAVPAFGASPGTGQAQGSVQPTNGNSPGAGANGRGTPVLTRSMSTPAPHHNCELNILVSTSLLTFALSRRITTRRHNRTHRFHPTRSLLPNPPSPAPRNLQIPPL